MGGRGGSGAKYGSPDGVFESKKPTVIETTYKRPRTGGYLFDKGFYKEEILEAVTDGKGNVTFRYAKNGEFEDGPKTNLKQKVKFTLLAGAVDGKPFNINWDKVNSISGQTYQFKDYAKKAGMKWNPDKKRWERR